MILAEKVVIISGVGPGLGRVLSAEAAKAGAKLVLVALTDDYAPGLAREIEASGGNALVVIADIAQQEECNRVVAAAVARYGRVDGLVNSAFGRAQFADFENDDLDGWRRAMDVTLFGALQMIKAVLPHMKAAGGGAIVNIGSMETRKPLETHGSYSVPKAALAGATRQLAVDLGKYNIRVNSAVMGWMWGPPVAGWLEGAAKESGTTLAAMKKAVAVNIPLGDIPPDQECAKSILVLLSDYTSQVTGAAFDVNGGEYMAL